jgi:hypothetical protein
MSRAGAAREASLVANSVCYIVHTYNKLTLLLHYNTTTGATIALELQ